MSSSKEIIVKVDDLRKSLQLEDELSKGQAEVHLRTLVKYMLRILSTRLSIAP